MHKSNRIIYMLVWWSQDQKSQSHPHSQSLWRR